MSGTNAHVILEEAPSTRASGPSPKEVSLFPFSARSEKALEAMTLGSARQLHLDSEVGSIEVGKAADLVILSNDPFSTGENTLLDASVLWTMTRGQVVHNTGGF